MYKLVRSILFFFPPESVHHFSMTCLKALAAFPPSRWLCARFFRPRQEKKSALHLFGLPFRNPVGLAAGFDKNASYLRELDMLGFGFVEIGTVTPKPQAGNERPRLFRLPLDKALINRMGFNNDGVQVVASRLQRWKRSGASSKTNRLIVGGNIGKNKMTPNEEAWKDYEICFEALHPYVDYFVVNVSSPNTPGLRELQEKDSLRKILLHLQELNQSKTVQRPVFLKIAPDLNEQQIDDVIALALEIRLDGLVVANTTISREGLTTPAGQVEKIGAGGLSGWPLQVRSTELVRYIAIHSNQRIPLIASGGIFSGKDAQSKMEAGASLVEVWTGFIYEGPMIVRRIVDNL